MKFNLIYLTFFLASFGFSDHEAHPAKLIIKNNSQRTLDIKVMEQYGGIERRYAKFSVDDFDEHTEYFSNSGNYFLKIKASIPGKDPLYTKGNPFKVYVGEDGYSELTITYTLKESNSPNPLEGKRINKIEFDKD